MKKSILTLALASLFNFFFTSLVQAETIVKPFILAASKPGDINQVLQSTRKNLQTAGFDIIGEYSPYDGASIIIFTSSTLTTATSKSVRGGYGGALRASVTATDDNIDVVYTNPVYWSNAYRMNTDLESVSSALESALGKLEEFGTGHKKLFASYMRKYHYTMFMEYFDDPSELASYENHEQAVAAVEKNLSTGAGGAKKVYRLNLGADSDGKPMTLFGVALGGKSTDDCSADAYIMNLIDKSSPRHTAHLPYEILVYGGNVEALYARFRIAISWPHLPMINSDDGATFFNIMCAPDAIEQALMQVAGSNTGK